MPGLLLVELEGTIIYKTRKNRISMVCEKCSHFVHMNLKNWPFITWYLCEKLLICVNIYAFPFLEKYSFNFQEFHECSTIQVTRIVVEVLSYKDVCYFSIFYDMCQIWGRLRLGFGAIYMSLKRISDVLLQLLEIFDSWDQFRFLVVRINPNHSFEFIYHFSH